MDRSILYIFLILCLFILPSGLTGQTLSTGSLEEYVRLHETPPREKIFLHLDRPNYIQGDTIWLKAYSWYGYNQMPDTLSGILYVDLIDQKGKIKLNKKLLIQNGTSWGDICIDTTIYPGKYSLRAYTLPMGNLNSGEPFYQTITINAINQNFHVECSPILIKQVGNDSLKINFRFFEISQTGDLNNNFNHEVSYSLKIGDKTLQKGKLLATNTKEQVLSYSLSSLSTSDSVAEFGIHVKDSRIAFDKQFQIPLQERIDLQFFPEGGKLITGLTSKVAFKAIGTDGLSREVNGEVKDNNENVITGFQSSHSGMGVFTLKPEADKKYFAHLWYNNLKYIIPLPTSFEEGCVISVGFPAKGIDPLLTIKQSPHKSNTQKYVIGNTYGKIWFSAIVKMTKDSCQFRIPVELLPEGVCRLTVLNANFEPECERLIYVDKKEQFKIDIQLDSSSYGIRSKVTLLIKTSRQDSKPLQTDLSLAVVDREQIIKSDDVNGICVSKLIESELKGYIQDASFYFKNDTITNLSALDLLLMTQGYRKFLPINLKPSKLEFQPEKSINVSGKIKLNGIRLLEKKFDYRGIELSLICFSDNPYLGQSRSDSLGQFLFQIPLRFGVSRSILHATTARKKPFYGDILLDKPQTLPHFKIPLTTHYDIKFPTVEIVQQLQAVKKTEFTQNLGYGVKTIDLPGVTVTANAKNWHHNFEPSAEKIVDLDSIDPTGDRYRNLSELLVDEFGAHKENVMGMRTITLPCIFHVSSGYFPPIYVINGEIFWNGEGRVLSKLDLLNSIPVNEIKKIMVLPPKNSISNYYASTDLLLGFIYQSLVVIETYNENYYRGDPAGIKSLIINGLDAPRVFYSPRYDLPSRKNTIYDGRATILWEPSIRTDTNGLAKVEFFTSDRKTVLDIIVNGIDVANGAPGQGKTQINSTLKK
jgi:hypothetical protein